MAVVLVCRKTGQCQENWPLSYVILVRATYCTEYGHRIGSIHAVIWQVGTNWAGPVRIQIYYDPEWLNMFKERFLWWCICITFPTEWFKKKAEWRIIKRKESLKSVDNLPFITRKDGMEIDFLPVARVLNPKIVRFLYFFLLWSII